MVSLQDLQKMAESKEDEEPDGTNIATATPTPTRTGVSLDDLSRLAQSEEIQNTEFRQESGGGGGLLGGIFEALLESDHIVSALTLGKVDVNDLPDPLQFAADTLLSPVGLLSVAAVPFTGGGSIAAAAGARAATRATLSTVGRVALRELVIDSAASSAVRLLDQTGALEAINDKHPALAVATAFAVGIGAGVGAHRAMAGMGVLRTAAEQERAAAAALVDSIQSQTKNKFELLGIVELDHGRAGIGAVLDDPGFIERATIRLKGLGVDNTKEFRQSEAGREILAMIRSEEILDQISMASAVRTFGDPSNMFQRVNPRTIDETPIFSFTRKNGDAFETNLVDLVRDPKKWDDLDLSDSQREYLTKSREFFSEVNEYMQELGLLKQLGVEDIWEAGDLYISQVALARNGELFTSRVDPFSQRVLDTVEAGRGEGIEYAGLAETGMFMLQFANQMDLDRQFRNAMDGLLVDPKGVLNATNPQWRALNGQMRELKDAIKAAEDERSELYAAWQGTKDTAGATPNRRQLHAIEKAKQDLDAKRSQLGAMNDQQNGLRDKLSDILNQEKRKTSIDSRFWGAEAGKPIPVRLWNGKFIKEIDLAAMRQWLQGQGLATLRREEGAASALRELGNMQRFFSATLDLSAPLVHGLPMLFSDPVAWAKATKGMFTAIFNDPLVFRQRYLDRHWDDIREMILEGEVPFGDVEIFNSLRANNRSTLATLTQRAVQSNRVSSTAFAKTTDAYDTFLLMARHEHYRSLRQGLGLSPQQAGTVVRNMTGALSPRRNGLPPTLRNIESVALFSPRLVRSTIAMVASGITKPHTVEGALQLRATLQTVAGMMALTVAANAMVAGLTGKSTEEFLADLEDHLNPLSGGDFLSVEIPGIGIKVGLGGQVRAIVQAVGMGITAPGNFAEWSQNENPILSFISSRKSPLADTGLGFLEWITGEDLNILPFEEVDGPLDFLKLTASSFVPFAASAAFEDGNLMQRVGSAAGEFVAGRTSPLSPFDEREQAVQDMSGQFGGVKKWEELSDRQRDLVYEANPGLKERLDKFFRDEPEIEANKTERNAANDQAMAAIQFALDGRLTRLTRSDFRERMDEILSGRAQRMASIGNLDPREFGNDSVRAQVLTAYFETFEQARLLAEAGTYSPLDFDLQQELESKLMADINSGKYGDPALARSILEGRMGFTDRIEGAEWYFANKDIIKESGYWDIPDVILAERYRDQLPGAIRDYSDLLIAIRTAEVSGDVALSRSLDRVRRRIDAKADAEKKRLRSTNGALDRALYENGYTTVIRNRALRSSGVELR